MVKRVKLAKKRGDLAIPIMATCTFIIMYLIMLGVIFRYLIIANVEAVSDEVTASALAGFSSKNIDLDRLALNPNGDIIVKPQEAYDTCIRHLKINMNLDNSFNPEPDSFVRDKVEVLDFILYNVDGTTVEAYQYDKVSGSFNKTVTANGKGVVMTPKGFNVNVTTIYIKIGYTMPLFLKYTTYMTYSENVEMVFE